MSATKIAWLCVQRTRLRFAIEDRVRDWTHAVTRLRRKYSGRSDLTPPRPSSSETA